MAEQTRQMYFIIAKELPVAIALDDVSYADAVAVAGQCVADGQILTGPDDGSVGYIVNFDRVAGVTVTSRKPTGPAMQMPTDLIERLLANSAEDFDLAPDDSDTEPLIAFYRARLAEQDCVDTDAKRELLNDYERCYREAHGEPARAVERRLLRSVIRRLAQPYAAHPDHRDEWRL
jgi:Family of unknown function (DUF6221)